MLSIFDIALREKDYVYVYKIIDIIKNNRDVSDSVDFITAFQAYSDGKCIYAIDKHSSNTYAYILGEESMVDLNCVNSFEWYILEEE